jgi:hypothetical protein
MQKSFRDFCKNLCETIFAIYLGITARELGLDNHVDPLLMNHCGAALHGRLLALPLAAHQVDQVRLLVAQQVNEQFASHVREADLHTKKKLCYDVLLGRLFALICTVSVRKSTNSSLRMSGKLTCTQQ